MQIWRSMRARSGRFLIVLLTVLVFITLVIIDARRSFTQISGFTSPGMLSFGFSMFVALFFLAVGTLVWLFARERWIAFLLFSLSFTTMMAFTLLTGAQLNDPVLSVFSDSGASLSLALLATLLIFFPVNHSAIAQEMAIRSGSKLRARLLRVYLLLIWVLCPLSVAQIVVHYLTPLPVLSWLDVVTFVFYLIVLSGSFATIVATYRRKSSLRERQQLRFFAIGVIVAIVPLLILTVLPGLLASLGIPAAPYIVNGQISSATVILLPAAFGYSILRYQILVFDRYIQRVVSWTMGVIFLAVLGYGMGVLANLLFPSTSVYYSGILISSLVLLAPFCWWLARRITERLFFSEMQHYRRLIDKPGALVREALDINEASTLLTLAAVNTFLTNEVCLFVYDRESGLFQLAPPLSEENPQDAARQRLAQQLARAIEARELKELQDNALPFQNVNWIKAGQLLLRNVDHASRPLFLSEAIKPEEEQPAGLSRFISTSAATNDPLLAAVRVQGEMIGLLALGERGDHGEYAGPDFDVIDLLLARYSPLLENARLYEQANRHGAMLNALYGANVSLERAYESLDDVASAYAAIAAATAQASADVWFVSGNAQIPRRICHYGDEPRPSPGRPLQERDWRPIFDEGSSLIIGKDPSRDAPISFREATRYPFAWLPLEKGEQRYGILILTYPRPHRFSEEEKRLWSMFASQCAAAIENARAGIDLRAAYERQKEVDRLKDQFIATASHELRTPLTAVQGYIDLLQSYDEQLTPEARAEFIAKAGRGCDELTLMVNNIMDASRVQEEIVEVALSPLPLIEPVMHVLEMMEAIITREDRRVTVQVSPDIVVNAEEQSLKQILLNLVSNALKYSPPGSPLEISALPGDDHQDAMCLLRIRDYGSGIPIEDQGRLFERFMRLERDMNSPVRGAGLGLYISKQLARSMGGSISVVSTGIAGEGSTFVVALKLHRLAQMLVP